MFCPRKDKEFGLETGTSPDRGIGSAVTHTHTHTDTVYTHAMSVSSERAANHPLTPEEEREPSNLVKDNCWGHKLNEMANKITWHTVHLIRNRHVPTLMLFIHLTKV